MEKGINFIDSLSFDLVLQYCPTLYAIWMQILCLNKPHKLKDLREKRSPYLFTSRVGFNNSEKKNNLDTFDPEAFPRFHSFIHSSISFYDKPPRTLSPIEYR
mmetsp:Transcript_21875/g.23844  ORF Transcript_21875/g.23844 Transcript_21875/m.23844 type:complete len:102 (+) Transcript_21875:145-450(+)